MKMVQLTLIALIFSINNLFAFDMSGTTFVDYVRFVSNTSKINIIIDEEIDTKFSLILPDNFNTKDSFKIFKQVLYKNDMYIVKYNSVYYIKKIDEDKHYHSVKLKYLLPDKIIHIIEKYHKNIIISKSKKTIIFQANNKESIEIKNLISLLDKATKTKKIKIELISFEDNNLEEFGLDMDIESSSDSGSVSYNTFVKGLQSSSSFSLSLDNFSLGLYLSDLKSRSLIDFKFSPTVSLFDNEITNFNLTKNIPYLSEDRSIDGTNDIESNSFTYKDVGSTININKVAITDDYVYFHIKMQYEIILDNSLTPVTAKRSIDNYVKLKNGQSIMITGLKGIEERIIKKEIPLLSSIWLIGDLFKWESNQVNKETFAIFLSNIEEDINLENYIDASDDASVKGVPTLVGK